MMDKIIKAIGTSKGVIFNRDESLIYDLHVGDIVKIVIIKITKKCKDKKDG